jgi:hypothetical protein
VLNAFFSSWRMRSAETPYSIRQIVQGRLGLGEPAALTMSRLRSSSWPARHRRLLGASWLAMVLFEQHQSGSALLSAR